MNGNNENRPKYSEAFCETYSIPLGQRRVLVDYEGNTRKGLKLKPFIFSIPEEGVAHVMYTETAIPVDHNGMPPSPNEASETNIAELKKNPRGYRTGVAMSALSLSDFQDVPPNHINFTNGFSGLEGDLDMGHGIKMLSIDALTQPGTNETYKKHFRNLVGTTVCNPLHTTGNKIYDEASKENEYHTD